MPEYHPSWDKRDSSKLDTWLDCKRKYFFEYVLGWRVDMPAHDLYFGQTFHIGREYQLIHGYNEWDKAYMEALDYYRKEFPESTDHLYTPKDPTSLMLALKAFNDHPHYKRDLTNNELLYTEISGSVPINLDGRVLYYRMDSVLRRNEDDRIFSWDHKTKGGDFNRWWEDEFYLCIQSGTYTHCLYCMFPIEQVLGIEFCGTSFKYLKRKGEYVIDLKRVSAWKTPEQMNNWLYLVNTLVDEIDREHDHLTHCRPSDTVMSAFPMNPRSCTKYRGCPYHDFCIAWPNPLRQGDEPPLGFKTEWWDPTEMETTNKKNLEWGK